MIEIRNLHKNFGGNKVLDGLDLNIAKRETLVIIGRSGCGKSVLLKHIIGLLKPDSGSIFIDGKDVTILNEHGLIELRRSFGMVFQNSALFDSLSVVENVAFTLRRQTDMSDRAIRMRVREKLALVGLSGTEELGTAELSGGMKKRDALARALAMDPRIILYDEPTTGLDPIMADAINDLIAELKKKLEITSIAVTHDMVSAYKIADRIAMLYDGKIVESGRPEQIKKTHNAIVSQFITGSAQGPITKGGE